MIVEGNDPITNQPVMLELVEKLTTPLTDAEKRTGELKQSEGPATFTDTPDNLHQMFLEKRWTYRDAPYGEGTILTHKIPCYGPLRLSPLEMAVGGSLRNSICISAT